MKIEIVSFALGSVCTIAIALIGLLVGKKFRHRCTCGRFKTKTFYRMFRVHHMPATSDGRVVYAVYKFRECEGGHVSVSMKQKLFQNHIINRKPTDQFEWNDDDTKRLLKKARMGNPREDYNLRLQYDPNPTPGIVIIGSQIITREKKLTCFDGHRSSSLL